MDFSLPIQTVPRWSKAHTAILVAAVLVAFVGGALVGVYFLGAR